MKAILGATGIGAAITGLAALEWGQTGANWVGLMAAIGVVLFGALIVFGRSLIDEVSSFIDNMP